MHTAPPTTATLVALTSCCALAGVYLLGVWLRHRRARRWSHRRTAAFLTGVATLAVAFLPPVAAFAHHDARGHMLQHLLIGMYAPIGLVLGAPITLLLGCIPAAAARAVTAVLRSRAFHILAHPVTAAVLNVGGLYLLYLTVLYAVSTEVAAAHYLVHVHFLLAGYLFTWALVGPDPAPRRPGVGVRVAALVAAAGAHAYLAKLLYAEAARLPPGTGHGVAEIRDAARWMYYGGDVAEIVLACALFAWWFRWRRRDRCAAPSGIRRPDQPLPGSLA